MLTSGLTEIQTLSSGYTVPATGLEIEIGGYTPGNPAGGNDIDGFDQVKVLAGTTNLSTGYLDVKLVNNFVPNIGDRFNFLQVDASTPVTTTFPLATGLFSFPTGDRYFDIVSDGNGGLTLEVKGFLGGLSFAPPANIMDGFGRFLGTYFAEPSFSYTGNLSVAGLADVSGTFLMTQEAGETLVVGTNATATASSEPTGLRVNAASFGLVVNSTGNYALEATGTAAISDFAGLSLAGNLSLERNTTGAAVTRTLTVNSTSTSISVASDANQFAGDNLTLGVGGFSTITGNFALKQQSGSLRGTASNVVGSLTSGSASVGVTDGTLGFVATADDKLALEATGALTLNASGISGATAQTTRLRYNDTNAAWTGTSIAVADKSYTFADLPQSSSLQLLSATGISASLANFVTLSGNAAFQRTSQELQAVLTGASAVLAAGSATAGVSAHKLP
jgi:hypothetical protein